MYIDLHIVTQIYNSELMLFVKYSTSIHCKSKSKTVFMQIHFHIFAELFFNYCEIFECLFFSCSRKSRYICVSMSEVRR